MGLPATRRHEWLLDIDFRKRELFAYACEAYSRILAAGGSREHRIDALDRHVEGELPSDETVEIDEYLSILAESVRSRNGWKVLLRRCSPTRPGNLHAAGTCAPNIATSIGAANDASIGQRSSLGAPVAVGKIVNRIRCSAG